MKVGTPGIHCRGSDDRRRPREVAAVGMYLEGKTYTVSRQAVYQERQGRGGKGDPKTLDWPTQKKGLLHVEPGVLKTEQIRDLLSLGMLVAGFEGKESSKI